MVTEQPEVVPGKQGACSCGCCRYHTLNLCWSVRHPRAGETVMTRPGPDQGVALTIRRFAGEFREGFCPYRDCGDFCGEGGLVRRNPRAEAEEMLLRAEANMPSDEEVLSAIRWTVQHLPTSTTEALRWNERRELLRELLGKEGDDGDDC